MKLEIVESLLPGLPAGEIKACINAEGHIVLRRGLSKAQRERAIAWGKCAIRSAKKAGA